MDADANMYLCTDDEIDQVPPPPPGSPDDDIDDIDDIRVFAVYPEELVRVMFGKTTEYADAADEFIFGGNETFADILLQITTPPADPCEYMTVLPPILECEDSTC